MKKSKGKIVAILAVCIVAVAALITLLALNMNKSIEPVKSVVAFQTTVPEPTKAPELKPITIQLNATNLKEFVDLDVNFSGFSKSYSSPFYFGWATLEVNCKPLEEVIYRNVSFTLEFKTSAISNLWEWDIPKVTMKLSETGRASTAKDCSYLSALSSAKSPVANGNYWIQDVTGTIEVKPDSPFYNMAKELYSK